MVTIIHGDDIQTSRKYFLDQKSKDAVIFDGEKITPTDIIQNLSGGGLFTTTGSIIIENFFTKKKAGLELDEIIAYVQKNQSANILFWEDKELTKKHLSFFPKAQIKQFSLPKTLFSFLDSIHPGKGKRLVASFHVALENSEVELLFFMLIRQFRLLLSCHSELALALSSGRRDSESNNSEPIDEVKRLAPWQIIKLEKQARAFSIDQLKNIYQKLGKIDRGVKTGTLSLTLSQAIDFFLLDI